MLLTERQRLTYYFSKCLQGALSVLAITDPKISSICFLSKLRFISVYIQAVNQFDTAAALHCETVINILNAD